MLFGIGCSATKLSYQPKEYNNISKSIAILKNSLKHQSVKHAVKSVEIKTDYIKILSSQRNKVNYIHFEYILNIELYEKNEWKVINLIGEDRRVMYRLYVKDETIAKEFINAIYTLKNHPEQLEEALNLKKREAK